MIGQGIICIATRTFRTVVIDLETSLKVEVAALFHPLPNELYYVLVLFFKLALGCSGLRFRNKGYVLLRMLNICEKCPTIYEEAYAPLILAI